MATARDRRFVIAVSLILGAVSFADAADHLLISEIVVTPTDGEFVEIFNPTDAAIDLSDVYLTDATYAPGGSFYYNIVTGNLGIAGGGGFGDFHARFPDGAMIAPHEYQTVAIAGSGLFFSAYAAEPTYELYEDDPSPDGIPDMREALPGSINSQGGLTNGGEVVILYRWNGASDLVQDLDYVLWGDKEEAVDKTGVAIDGPDPDSTATTYFNDTAIANQDVNSVASHLIGESFTRVDKDEGTETMVSGNGITGHDETSENLSSTFADLAVTPNGGSLLAIGVSIDDVSDLEGDSGTTLFIFTVSLTELTTQDITVDLSYHDVTAGTGADWEPPSMIQTTIAAGDPSTVILVSVFGDLEGEINEQFRIHLSNPTGTGAEILDGDGIGTILNDDPVAIHVIQGAGESSPLAGSVVTTQHGVVTAIGPEGFFIQTADGFDDGNPDTSEGLYVFTAAPPSVVWGQITDVTGTVAEFYGFTQLEDITDISYGGPAGVPWPIVFDAATPSPDPTAPSCALEYECNEGMLVSAAGLVVGPTQAFGTDPTAEFFAVATAGPQPFREIGAEYPGFQGVIALPPGVPVFDGNPEIFEVDPDKLGVPNMTAKPGDTYLVSGPLGYEFGGWEIWASDQLEITPGPSVVDPVRPAGPGEMTVASLNMFRHYDDVDDPLTQDEIVSADEFQRRQTKFRRYILDVLRAPDILGVQEVENLAILSALAADIEAADPAVVYNAHLVPGNNAFGMNVGFLVRDTVQTATVTQLGFDDILVGWGYKLFDHPPLLVEGTWVGGGGPGFDIAVMNNHTRSLSGVDDPYDDFAREKRFQQAQSIAQKVQDLQTAEPNTPLVLVGDYNAFEFTDGYVDVIGQIRGEVTPEHNVLSGPVITAPPLANEIEGVPAGERYSYLYRGTHQVFDHALTSRAAQPYVTGQHYGRGNADSPGYLIEDDTVADRSSDHDGMVLYLDTASVLFADGFETGDTTRWSSATH